MAGATAWSAAGAIVTVPRAAFPDKLLMVHDRLARLLAECRPDCVAVESLFHAVNARSALRLGHVRGVAMLAAVEGRLPGGRNTPRPKSSVPWSGYGRAEKHQVGEMVRLLLGLTAVPTPHDAADALAVAICHIHSQTGDRDGRGGRRWRRRGTAAELAGVSAAGARNTRDGRSPGATAAGERARCGHAQCAAGRRTAGRGPAVAPPGQAK